MGAPSTPPPVPRWGYEFACTFEGQVDGGDNRYTMSMYALLCRSILGSLLCYCVRVRDHHCSVFLVKYLENSYSLGIWYDSLVTDQCD